MEPARAVYLYNTLQMMTQLAAILAVNADFHDAGVMS